MGFESFNAQSSPSAAAVEREKNTEELKNVPVAELMRESNSFMVHDIIVADYKEGKNNKVLDTKGMTFDESFKLLSGIEGVTISCSSVRYGSADRTYGIDSSGLSGNPGVFLRGGRIKAANTHDSGTQALTASGRTFHDMPTDAQSEAWIKKVAIERDTLSGNRYNEIIVSHPEIAGVYFRMDYFLSDSQRQELESTGTLAEIDGTKRSWDPMVIKTSMASRTVGGVERMAALNEESWEHLGQAFAHGVPVFVLTRDNKAFLISHIDKKNEELTLVKGAVDPGKLLDMANAPHPGIAEIHKQDAAAIFDVRRKDTA